MTVAVSVGDVTVPLLAEATLVMEPASNTYTPGTDNSCPICFNQVPLPSGVDPVKVARVEIFDISGRLVRDLGKGSASKFALDITDLPTGTYCFKLLNTNGMPLAIQRFIKK